MYQVIEFYEQNLRLSRKTGDQQGEMSALRSLGRAYAALGSHDQAVECYNQAIDLARQIGDARGERQTLRYLNEILNSPTSQNFEQVAPLRKSRKKANPATAKSARRKSSRQLSAATRPRQKSQSPQGTEKPEMQPVPVSNGKKRKFSE